ncbi:MAG: YtxH domain-containing protein [Bacteroidia bacterium]|nr:YtxH domain-containing protein [Bacteroidia bacterium]
MENTNNSGKIIAALLVGAAIGGVLGILFAPDKGSETRKKISGKTEDLAGSLKEKFNSFMEEAKKEFERSQQEASEQEENLMENKV